MKNKIKFRLNEEEISIIMNSLNIYRNSLISQEKSVEDIDEIIVQLQRNKTDFDSYSSRVVIKSLDIYRHLLKNQGKPRNKVSDLTVRLIDTITECENGKKKLILRMGTKGNARR